MVFISYSSRDYEQAQKLRTRLENDGISCWMAPENIRAGQDYASEIPAAIANCSVFLLLLTDNAQKSTWVPKELDTAINHSRPIVPFHSAELVMTPSFAFKLVNVQSVIAIGEEETDYNNLCKALKRCIPGQPEPAVSHLHTTDPLCENVLAQERKRRNRKHIRVILVISMIWFVLACSAVIAMIYQMRRPELDPVSSASELNSSTAIPPPSISVTAGNYLLLAHPGDTCTIVEYTDKNVEQLTVPSSIMGYKVTGIWERAFADCNQLVSITLPKGLTEIGELAFRNCKQLINITLPEGLISIGVAAFSGCDSLKAVELPSTLQKIDNQAFLLCSSLNEVRLPDHLIKYGAYAFSSSATVVVIKDTLTEQIIRNLDYDMGLPKEFVFAAECRKCFSDGSCIYCRGAGKQQYNLYEPATVCKQCDGTGKCIACQGKGYIQ